MTSSKPSLNRTRSGDIPKLTHNNYDEWKDDTILILSAMKAYAMVTGEDPEPHPLDFDHDDNLDVWQDKEAKDASMIRLACYSEARRSLKGIRNRHEMWNTLDTSLDTTECYVGRQDILRLFHACQPKKDEPRKAYFTKLSNYGMQLDHTDDAVTNGDFCNAIFAS
jgi:hypothetical protein